MKLSRRTLLILGCMNDVRRARVRVARAWRDVRGGLGPRTSWGRELWRCQDRLAGAVRTLELAWDLCVRIPGAEVPVG